MKSIPYSGFLSREQTFANFTSLVSLWRFVKVFSAKFYFQAIRYRAGGRGALGYRKFANVFSAKIYFQVICISREQTFANFASLVSLWRFVKVFSAKFYFQAIGYRAGGRGALGYRKFANVFSAKIYFQAICESFLPRKKPAILYKMIYFDGFFSFYLDGDLVHTTRI